MMCEKCGKRLEVGEWPFCPHGKGSFGYTPFIPHFDIQRGKEFRFREERQKYDRDHHVEMMSKNDVARVIEEPASSRRRIEERWKGRGLI